MNLNIQQPPFSPTWGNSALKDLVEVAAPVNISWLPQTTGWSIVLLLIFSWLLFKLYKQLKHYIANAYRRAALLELDKLLASPALRKDIPVLLRRTALYAYQRKAAASLSDSDWEVWLDEQCSKCRFSTEYKGQLKLITYGKHHELSQQATDDLYHQIAVWISFHKGAK